MKDNKTWLKIYATHPKLAATIAADGGFVAKEILPQLIELDRHMLLLVRCNNGRFMCPAQDVEHFCQIIEEHQKVATIIESSVLAKNGDWVRDIGLPA